MDLVSEMLKNRILLLNDTVDNKSANDLILKLLYLDSLNHEDIYLYINSNGGDVFQGLAIIDCIHYVKSKVITVVVGTAYSMAAIILACGVERYSLPHSEIMIHQPLGNASGKATEILSSSERINETRLLLAKMLEQNSKRSLKRILQDMDKDYFMKPDEALEYGIIDKVIAF